MPKERLLTIDEEVFLSNNYNHLKSDLKERGATVGYFYIEGHHKDIEITPESVFELLEKHKITKDKIRSLSKKFDKGFFITESQIVFLCADKNADKEKVLQEVPGAHFGAFRFWDNPLYKNTPDEFLNDPNFCISKATTKAKDSDFPILIVSEKHVLFYKNGLFRPGLSILPIATDNPAYKLIPGHVADPEDIPELQKTINTNLPYVSEHCVNALKLFISAYAYANRLIYPDDLEELFNNSIDEIDASTFFPAYHLPQMDNFSKVSSKNATRNYSGSFQVTVGEGKNLLLVNGQGKTKISPQTDKLRIFSEALSYKTGRPEVVFPTDFWLRLIGKPIDADEDAQDKEKEAKRAARARKEGRNDLITELNSLRTLAVSFRTKGGSYNKNIVDGAGPIDNDRMMVTFNTDYFELLKSHKIITQYSPGLFKIDPRRENAYRIAFKMCVYANNTTNINRKRNKRLSVKTLLECTDLPTINQVLESKSKRTWQERIKEKLENSLEYLVSINFLNEFFYTKARGELLTEEELKSINTYDVFINLYVQFEIADMPDHTEDLERQQKRIEINTNRKLAREQTEFEKAQKAKKRAKKENATL